MTRPTPQTPVHPLRTHLVDQPVAQPQPAQQDGCIADVEQLHAGFAAQPAQHAAHQLALQLIEARKRSFCILCSTRQTCVCAMQGRGEAGTNV